MNNILAEVPKFLINSKADSLLIINNIMEKETEL